jgi:hypothetical protein
MSLAFHYSSLSWAPLFLKLVINPRQSPSIDLTPHETDLRVESHHRHLLREPLSSADPPPRWASLWVQFCRASASDSKRWHHPTIDDPPPCELASVSDCVALLPWFWNDGAALVDCNWWLWLCRAPLQLHLHVRVHRAPLPLPSIRTDSAILASDWNRWHWLRPHLQLQQRPTNILLCHYLFECRSASPQEHWIYVCNCNDLSG